MDSPEVVALQQDLDQQVLSHPGWKAALTFHPRVNPQDDSKTEIQNAIDGKKPVAMATDEQLRQFLGSDSFPDDEKRLPETVICKLIDTNPLAKRYLVFQPKYQAVADLIGWAYTNLDEKDPSRHIALGVAFGYPFQDVLNFKL